MAAPAPNSAFATSAPTAPTADLVQTGCHVVHLLGAALVLMGLSQAQCQMQAQTQMCTTSRPPTITLAVLVRELPVEEDRCTSTKHISITGDPHPFLSTCGSTARMGNGLCPSLLETAIAAISMFVRARTPLHQSLMISMPGVHARTVALQPALRRPRPHRRTCTYRTATLRTATLRTATLRTPTFHPPRPIRPRRDPHRVRILPRVRGRDGESLAQLSMA